MRWNERNPGGTLVDYGLHVASEDFEASPLLSYRAEDDDRVTVTTLHQAKGLDFDVVFISDAVEGVFPDLRTRDSLLGTRHLQPYLPADTAGYLAFRLQEERRLAYTAMTRATRRVVWTATDSGFDVDGGTPSRFLPLAAGARSIDEAASHPGAQHRPITIGQAEAALRRIAADPPPPPPQPLAAIPTHAQGEVIGLRNPATLAGLAERGPDIGLVEHPLLLSPSQATAYETCPRSYALERKLAIGAETSLHMEFGTLVHSILEQVENSARERGDRHGTIEEALEALEATLSPGAFGGGAYDTAWTRRATTALENIYSLWPSRGDPIGAEVDLMIERDGVRWRGRADRIERRGSGVAVVDYKTGNPTTRNDAATSLQLGVYLIAAREHPDLAAAGDVSDAEMWFPLHPLKRSIATRSFDAANVAAIETRMTTIAQGIAAEKWDPTPGAACDRCTLRVVCPAVPEGKEAFDS
jgi:ATP-dependent exoDNAse (exonuclease V) beta subunit